MNPESGHGLVIGEVIYMHIRDDLINGHRINHQLLKPTGRLAGSMYCHTADVFEMERPVLQRVTGPHARRAPADPAPARP